MRKPHVGYDNKNENASHEPEVKHDFIVTLHVIIVLNKDKVYSAKSILPIGLVMVYLSKD